MQATPSHAMPSSLLARLDARDRALFARWTIDREAAGRRAWVAVTHLGGAWSTCTAAALPAFAGGALRSAAIRATAALVVSHALVQLLKRNVVRERPVLGVGADPLVSIPDAFSFPSGHSTAALSVALAYAIAFPSLAPLLLSLAIAVGVSRVVLRVHYPGDVLAGQAIAVVTNIVICAVR
jgi:undecaprenyl-diphosphatase